MVNSDSESESECFESAEESFDENDEIKVVETNSPNNENDISKCQYTTSEVEKDISGALAYRRRRERVKHSVGHPYKSSIGTSTKPTFKLPSNETIFKSDKIVPDAFFQDITTNLTKNINKSLSTFHQKSSNVKDLILSSLPVSSDNEKQGFSYDDKTVKTEIDVKQVPLTEQEFQNNDSSQCITSAEEKNLKEDVSCRDETFPVESNTQILNEFSEECTNKTPLDIKNDEEKTSSVEKSISKSGVATDDIIQNSAFLTQEKQNASLTLNSSLCDLSKSSQKNEVDTDIDTVFIKKKEKVKQQDCLNIVDQEGTKCKELFETESLKTDIFLKNNNENNQESESKESIHKTERVLESTFEKPSEHTVNNLSPNDSSLNCQENLEEAEIKINSSSIENCSNLLPEHKSEVESKFNLQDLKASLENIAEVEKIISANSNNFSENEFKKESCSEEKKEYDPSSNEGWDDFDFSDSEVENIDHEKTCIKSSNFKEKGPELEKVEVKDKKSINDNKSQIKENNQSTLQNMKKNLKSDKIEDHIILKKSEVSEPATVSDVSWDWDSWNDIPDDEKDTSEMNTIGEKTKNEKTMDDFSDVSKWGGWDTFAQKPQEKQGSWGLGSWGVDAILNKATAVSQGISNVLEAGLGVPDPETLARMDKTDREELKQIKPEKNEEEPNEIHPRNSATNVNLFPVSGITSLVAGVTSKIIEHSKIQEIGSKVITGGLDTLETFGKKTMEVLQEGDPGLKNKRALLMGNNKTILSQVLREAREKADKEMKMAEEKEMAKKCHFETLFDDFQGMVHLEALEMLSRQCELKLDQIRSGMNSEEQDDLNGVLEEVEQLCALDEYDFEFKSSVVDFKTVLNMAVKPLENEISVHKIIKVHEEVNEWLEKSSETEPSLLIIHQKLVSTLAELTAATVHQFHKSGELLSVKECRKTVEEVDSLSRLTNVMCAEINTLCEKFMSLSQKRSGIETLGENLNSINEKVLIIKKNSTSYIRQAFDLLIPVLQLGAAV